VTGLQAYQIYNALKLHYTDEKFDAYKYNFKVRVSPRTFDSLRYRYTFEKLGAKHDQDYIIDYITSNMIENVMWIHDMTKDNYDKREARLQSITYRLKKDLAQFQDFNKMCECIHGNNLLIDAFIQEEVSLETVSIIDSLVNFIKPLLPKLIDPLQMKRARAVLAMKYKSSLTKINMKKMREEVIKAFTYA
jgi:Zn-dependent M32 family carboxypeptidase|tara:strand:- start:255 stop:827 length:573 start_codon:yes stop_codon:yes gene_type:complete